MLRTYQQPYAGESLPFINGAITPDPVFLALALADSGTVALTDAFDRPNVLVLTGAWTGIGFLFGDPDCAKFIVEAAEQIASHQRSPWCCLSVEELMAARICEINSTRFFGLQRVSYRFDYVNHERCAEQIAALPDGFHIEPLRKELSAQIRQELDEGFNLDSMDGVPFAGLVMCHHEQVVSYAWAPIAGGLAEIGVMTAPVYRGRGFATHLTTRLIQDELIPKGIVPHGSTNSSNEPAKRWASACGFVEPFLHNWMVVRK